jgi:hypothetical protein
VGQFKQPSTASQKRSYSRLTRVPSAGACWSARSRIPRERRCACARRGAGSARGCARSGWCRRARLVLRSSRRPPLLSLPQLNSRAHQPLGPDSHVHPLDGKLYNPRLLGSAGAHSPFDPNRRVRTAHEPVVTPGFLYTTSCSAIGPAKGGTQVGTPRPSQICPEIASGLLIAGEAV